MLKSVLLSLLCCSAAYAAGGLYKWVDEHGNVQYRDTPPPTSGSYETLRKPPAPSQNPAEAMKELRQKTESVDKAKEEQKQQDADQKLKEIEARRAESCAQAKENLAILEKREHPVRVDEQGKKVVLSDEEKQAEVERNRKYVQFYCDKAETASGEKTP